MYIPRPPVPQRDAAALEKIQAPNYKPNYKPNNAAFSSYAARHLATLHTAEALSVFGAENHDAARALIQRCVMLVLLKKGLPGLEEFAPEIDRLFSFCNPSWTAEFDKLLVAICRKEAAQKESVADMRRLLFSADGNKNTLLRMQWRAREAAVLYTAIYAETVAMRDAAKSLKEKEKKKKGKKGKGKEVPTDSPCSMPTPNQAVREVMVLHALRGLLCTEKVDHIQRLQQQMAKILGLDDVTEPKTKVDKRKRKRTIVGEGACPRAKRRHGLRGN